MPQDADRLLSILSAQPVVPVVAVETAETGVALARTLAANGVSTIEVTLRTEAGLDAIRAIAEAVPEITCGAGTVLNADQFGQAAKAGARFIVSPGATQEILDAAKRSDVPLLPGAATPSEMMAILEEGYRVLKFFPAEPAGGVAYLKALAPVLPALTFCPTGGVSTANVNDYLALPNVVCVGGSWLAPKDKLATGDWDSIGRLAAATQSLK